MRIWDTDRKEETELSDHRPFGGQSMNRIFSSGLLVFVLASPAVAQGPWPQYWPNPYQPSRLLRQQEASRIGSSGRTAISGHARRSLHGRHFLDRKQGNTT